MFDLLPLHSRAARSLLRWSQETLSVRSGVSLSTIRDFEAERRIPIAANKRAIKQSLDDAGIIFLDEEPGRRGPGVCLKWDATRKLEAQTSTRWAGE